MSWYTWARGVGIVTALTCSSEYCSANWNPLRRGGRSHAPATAVTPSRCPPTGEEIAQKPHLICAWDPVGHPPDQVRGLVVIALPRRDNRRAFRVVLDDAGLELEHERTSAPQFFLAIVSLMGILSGPEPHIVDVRRGESTPYPADL